MNGEFYALRNSTGAGKILSRNVGEFGSPRLRLCARLEFSIVETAMPDDPKKTGQDRKLISLEEPHEVRSWTQSLGCTEQQLRAAVAAVGHSADRVREFLRKGS